MSVGGSSNLGTLLIRRLDTALGVQASQQSQIVNAARSDAIAQLADAARVNPLQNETGRPLPESIEKAQAQVQRQGRQPLENTRQLTQPVPARTERPATETSTTASAPTTLGNAARTILALLSLFPEQAAPVNGRAPLLQNSPAGGNATAGKATANSQSAAGQATSSASQAPATSTGATGAGYGATSAAAATAQLGGAMAASNPQAALFARALSVALQQSGMFYESHLRELAFGGRTAAQLKLEPQGQLGRPSSPTTAQTATSASNTAPQAATTSAEPASTDARSAGPSGPSSSATSQTAMASSSSASTLAGLHPETNLMVRQQLEVLANQVFVWRGEAWPDTQMEWEVARRNEQDLPDEDGTHWATRLRVSLPQLGEVEARLSLHDKEIVMHLVAPQSAQTLMQHGQDLRSDFQQAGLTLSRLSIHDEDQP